MTIFLVIILMTFGQTIIIVGNNMTPNLNVGDTIIGIRPILNNGLCNLSIIPGINKIFNYKYGDVIIAKSSVHKLDAEVIHPRIIRVVAMPGDKVIIKPKTWTLYKTNGEIHNINYKKYGLYCYEQIDKKAYLVMPGIRKIEDEKTIIVPDDSILCMYDNRYNPEQGVSEVLMKQNDVYCIPIINLSNIKKYYEFFIN